ncbi:MAG TPA: response regulator, partial [Polyangiaceae bacterium]|nr:response regulator [Polyangiaceae bacterium]
RDIALVHKLLPVLERPDRIFVAMAYPEDKKVLEELEFVTGRRVFAYIALEGVLLRSIRDAYDAAERGEPYYVGPTCPTETLVRAGLDPALYAREPLAAPEAPPPPPPPAPEVLPPPPPPAPPQRPGPPPAPKPPPPRAARSPFETPTKRIQPIPRDEDEHEDPPPTVKPSAAPTTPPTPLAEQRLAEQRMRPSSAAIPAADKAAAVIVDDKMQRASLAEVAESDFGDVAEELSMVGTMPRSSRPPPAGRKKILVVDDEPDIRRLIKKVLEERGHVVVEADRGKLALQLVKVENPDLVVLDAMLPEVHGFDIAKRIRGSSRYGHIPIVMVSAVYRGWRFAQDAKESYGVDAYIEKPFKVQELAGVVDAALKQDRANIDPERISAEAERCLKEGVAAYQSGKLDNATELLEKGVQLDPLAYRLRFHLGLLYGKRGQLYDGIEQLERAVQIQSQHFASVKNLAILYQQAGFKNKAVEAWERALKLATDEETRVAIKEHIVSLL